MQIFSANLGTPLRQLVGGPTTDSIHFAGKQKKKKAEKQADTFISQKPAPETAKSSAPAGKPTENSSNAETREKLNQALFQATWALDTPAMEKALQEGANPNYRDSESGDTALVVATRLGSEKAARFLIEHGAKVNRANQKGLLPLHVASQQSDSAMVKRLISTPGVKINEPEPNTGETAAHMAMLRRSPSILHALLAAKASLKARDKQGETPLHQAARNPNPEFLNAALAADASVEAVCKQGYTPLHLTAGNGTVENTRLLLEDGAKVNVFSKAGFTPLHLAAGSGHLETAQLLLNRCADINAHSRPGITPLYMSVGLQQPKVSELLIHNGADPRFSDEHGVSVSELAASVSPAYYQEIETMFKEGQIKANALGNVGYKTSAAIFDAYENPRVLEDSFNPHGQNLLHEAVLMDDLPSVQVLHKKGYKLFETDAKGNTPLHLAACRGNIEIAAFLLKNQAKINIQNNNQETPLHIASEKGDLEMVQLLLLDKGAKKELKNKQECTPLHLASAKGHTDTVETLLKAGASIKTCTLYGYSVLHTAAQFNRPTIIKMLLEKLNQPKDFENSKNKGFASKHKASTNTPSVDIKGEANVTPLHVAAKLGHVAAAQTLLEGGASPDAEMEEKNTPLHLAASGGHEELIQLLLQHKADVNRANALGYRPLHVAAKTSPSIMPKLNGMLKVLGLPVLPDKPERFINTTRLLLENGSEIEAKTLEGFTPVFLSEANRNDEMTALLIKHGASLNQRTKNDVSALDLMKNRLSSLFIV